MATSNQEKVFVRVQKQIRKGNKVSVSRAMRESGVYSPHVTRMPTKLTQSKGWKELLDKYAPESKLTKVLQEGLKATQVRFTPEGEKIKVEDYATRHKYLSTGLELHGKTKPEQSAITNNFLFLDGEQLRQIAARVQNGDSTGASTLDRLSDSNEPEVQS